MFAGCLHDQDLPSDGTAGFFGLSRLNVRFDGVRVQQDADDGSLGNQLVQQSQPFGGQIEVEDSRP